MNLEPLVSVIFTTYNERTDFLELSIGSVLDQTYSNIEVVVVLEPNDINFQAIHDFLEGTNSIIIENPLKLGFVKSLNRALGYATGQYIARLDSDDIWEVSKLEKQVQSMLHNNWHISGTDVELIDEFGSNVGLREYSKRSVRANFLFQNGFCHPSVIFKKELIERCGNYDETFKQSEDLELWLRFLSENFRSGYVNERLIKYRVRSNLIRDFKNWRFSFISRRRYVFKIYNPILATLSLTLSAGICLFSYFKLDRLLLFAYQKTIVNDKTN